MLVAYLEWLGQSSNEAVLSVQYKLETVNFM